MKTEYFVAIGTRGVLIDAVNDMIEDGWEPVGGVAYIGGEDLLFAQAMILAKKLPENIWLDAQAISVPVAN